ncbi:MAG TPA: LysE family transporter [Desulfobacter sp.]|nr:LysE family transporter [Desulfobacter sp.]
MGKYLFMGMVLGLSAGLSPGPLLALVISETIRLGIGAGIRVAMAPLISDIPVLIISFVLVSYLSGSDAVLGVISLAGAGLILKMGISSIQTTGQMPQAPGRASESLMKGVLVNILSPHPYLFWITVGTPLVSKAWQVHPGGAIGFVAGFYLLLVGSKLFLAFVVARTRSFLTGGAYIWTMRLLGLLLCCFAWGLAREGAELLGGL